MRKIVGIGETILDIIFEKDKPKDAVVGGSTLNGLVSLSRLGLDVSFISEIGDDHVGDIILDFFRENNINAEFVDRLRCRKSPVSLAFLGEDKSAQYIFHTDYPEERLNIPLPEINENDIFVFGSFYALNPLIRDKFKRFVETANERKAIVYYDVNFRPSHNEHKSSLMTSIKENFKYSTIIRGSDEDFRHLYNMTDMDKVYNEIIKPQNEFFLTTHGADGVNLFSGSGKTHFTSRKLTPVSTIGAGDNFNAGIVYGLVRHDIKYDDLKYLSKDDWTAIVQSGIDLSAEVCCSMDNYISVGFAEKYGKRGGRLY